MPRPFEKWSNARRSKHHPRTWIKRKCRISNAAVNDRLAPKNDLCYLATNTARIVYSFVYRRGIPTAKRADKPDASATKSRRSRSNQENLQAQITILIHTIPQPKTSSPISRTENSRPSVPPAARENQNIETSLTQRSLKATAAAQRRKCPARVCPGAAAAAAAAPAKKEPLSGAGAQVETRTRGSRQFSSPRAGRCPRRQRSTRRTTTATMPLAANTGAGPRSHRWYQGSNAAERTRRHACEPRRATDDTDDITCGDARALSRSQPAGARRHIAGAYREVNKAGGEGRAGGRGERERERRRKKKKGGRGSWWCRVRAFFSRCTCRDVRLWS